MGAHAVEQWMLTLDAGCVSQQPNTRVETWPRIPREQVSPLGFSLSGNRWSDEAILPPGWAHGGGMTLSTSLPPGAGEGKDRGRGVVRLTDPRGTYRMHMPSHFARSVSHPRSTWRRSVAVRLSVCFLLLGLLARGSVWNGC